MLVLAILASGCRWTGTNTAYTITELQHHFRLSEAKYVVVAEEHLDTVRRAVVGSGLKVEIILFSDILHATDDTIPCTNGVHLTVTSPFEVTQRTSSRQHRTLHQCFKEWTDFSHANIRKLSSDNIAALMQTSGTTGKPKLAIRSHRGLLAEMIARQNSHTMKPYQVSRLVCTPIFHGFTLPVVLDALRLGIPTYIMKRLDDTFASKIDKYGITETFVVPVMLMHLIQNPETYSLVQSLQLIACGGSPLPSQLMQKTLRLFNASPRIIPVYGLTEGGWLTTLGSPSNQIGSVGKPIAGLEMKICAMPNEKTTGNGPHTGELLVRGKQLMEGYFGNSMESAAAMTGGWLKTGDIVSIKDGHVYYMDRRKSLIKVNGFQVSPAEMEAVLMQCTEVTDAAVFGVGCGVDEHPVVCAVPTYSGVTDEMIKTFLRTQLASYKVARCQVIFIASIPRNSTGKVVRNALKQHIEATKVRGSL